MRWWSIVVGVGLALGCAGFGATPEPAPVETVEPTPVEGGPAADHTGGDAAADTTGDTGEVEEPREPRRKAHKGKRARPTPIVTPRPPRQPKPAKKKPPPQPPPKPDGIEQVGDTHWRVSRALVQRWQDNPYALAGAREKDPGWELVGVRVHHAYWLGMKNKDLLMLVNGHKLNTKPQLLSAYLACKNDEEFDVTFVRAGQTVVHHYSIVD